MIFNRIRVFKNMCSIRYKNMCEKSTFAYNIDVVNITLYIHMYYLHILFYICIFQNAYERHISLIRDILEQNV